MVIHKPSLVDRFTSRKFILALLVFLIAGLGGLAGYVQEPDVAKDLGIGAVPLYLIIQGAIDWIKTKKVYEAQAAAAAVTGMVPAVDAVTATGPDPHTKLDATPTG